MVELLVETLAQNVQSHNKPLKNVFYFHSYLGKMERGMLWPLGAVDEGCKTFNISVPLVL